MKTILAILLLVLVLLQVRLWTGAGSMTEIARLEDEIAEQTGENANLEARNSGLMEEVGDLRNGLDSIEERARSELGLIRHGETYYLIVDNEESTPEQDEPQVATAALAPESMPASAALIEVAPEPPPEIAEDDNPYLDVFRDDEDIQAGAPAAGQ